MRRGLREWRIGIHRPGRERSIPGSKRQQRAVEDSRNRGLVGEPGRWELLVTGMKVRSEYDIPDREVGSEVAVEVLG